MDDLEGSGTQESFNLERSWRGPQAFWFVTDMWFIKKQMLMFCFDSGDSGQTERPGWSKMCFGPKPLVLTCRLDNRMERWRDGWIKRCTDTELINRRLVMFVPLRPTQQDRNSSRLHDCLIKHFNFTDML